MRANWPIRRRSGASASNRHPTMPKSPSVRVLVPLWEFNQCSQKPNHGSVAIEASPRPKPKVVLPRRLSGCLVELTKKVLSLVTSELKVPVSCTLNNLGIKQMPDPTLKIAKVTFETADEDKRQESVLDLRIIDKDDNRVTRANGAFGKFNMPARCGHILETQPWHTLPRA
jgi:hypothetical protein